MIDAATAWARQRSASDAPWRLTPIRP